MANKKDFAHLHVHTQYSLLDGATKTDEIFALAGEKGQSAVAITDHGNMYGVLDFVKKAVAYTDPEADFYDFIKEKRPFKVKPIVGCEVYVTKDLTVRATSGGRMPKLNHLVLLAKNKEGYHNLIKLVSIAYTKGMYYKPRIDFNLLKQYSKGIVCLSACLAGTVPQALLQGDIARAKEIALEHKAIFGDDYYIEIQDHGIKEQRQVLPHLISIAKECKIKLVATNDVHYLTKEDSKMQKVLQCISFRKTMTIEELDETSSSFDGEADDTSYFPTREFYLKSRAEMEEVFPELSEALDNTLEIANKCDCYFFEKKPLLPSYVPDSGEEAEAFFRRITYDGLKRKYKEITPAIKERAEKELGIISRMGFVDYFLIVWDFINYAEQNDIPVGPGRGSGVGSIVAYALGITKLCPLKYELIFERFLNPERVSSPDFDIDFCVDRREEVIQYVVEKYGAENVSQIITFGTLASKAAVKDVGRVFNHPYSEVERMTKLFPEMMGKKKLKHILGKELFGTNKKEGKSGENVAVAELKQLYESDDMAKKILDMAMKVEGMPRQTGMHAAGVIICKDPISEHIPLAKTSDDIVTTEFNMIECEELGLLKMDFLGLRTLTDIKKALDIIKQTRGKDIDFYNMEYNDKGVFDLIGEGDTHAVFQLESGGMKKFMRDLKPTLLEDIIAGISLYRPGPMDKIPDYIAGKRDPKRIKYDHKLLQGILDVTYGIMVYQEQVMQIVQVLAGYSMGRADELRRIMGKKNAEKMAKERKVFLYGLPAKKKGEASIPGAVANGVPENVANKIFDDMVSFANYAFNKSHAAAYTYLSYQTAYLKTYYTVEFITAVLNNRISSIDEITNYLTYLKHKNIQVLPPNINRSYTVFSVENGATRIGMGAIKNVGMAIIDEIIKERTKHGDFKDFEDFITRMSYVTLNKKMLESLILAGTFDCFGNTRSQLMQVYAGVLARSQKDKEAKTRGQFSFFDGGLLEQEDVKVKYPVVKEFSLADKLRYEKEVSGVYISGHPLDEYTDFLKKFDHNSLDLKGESESIAVDEDDEVVVERTSLQDGSNVTLGGMLVDVAKKQGKTGKEFMVGKLEDLHGTVDVVCFDPAYRKISKMLEKDKLVTVRGKFSVRDMGNSVRIESVEPFGKSTKSVQSRKICFYLDSSLDKNLVSELQEILFAYEGKNITYIKFVKDNKLVELGIGVSISDTMLTEVSGLLGEGKYKII